MRTAIRYILLLSTPFIHAQSLDVESPSQDLGDYHHVEQVMDDIEHSPGRCDDDEHGVNCPHAVLPYIPPVQVVEPDTPVELSNQVDITDQTTILPIEDSHVEQVEDIDGKAFFVSTKPGG